MVDAERLRHVRDGRVLVLERERRGARDHAQALHFREHVEQLLAETVREVVVRLVVAHVDEGQHGDRGGTGACPWPRDRRGRRSGGGAGVWFPVHVAIEYQHPDCHDEQAADHQVELARGRIGDRLVTVDLVLALQALRGQLVDPGEDQRERKAEHEQPQHEARRPVRQFQNIEQELGNLQDHPPGNQVQQRDPDYIAALQLGNQGHCGVLGPIVAARMHWAGRKSTRMRGSARRR